MKRLISLIASGLLFFGGNVIAQEVPELISQEEVFSKLGIPEKFVNYKEGAEVIDNINPKEYGVFYLLDYIKEGVWVRESRDVSAILPDGLEMTKHPTLYAFDLNNDGEFQREEVLFDDAADGLNGNEVWFRDKLLEKEQSTL